MPSASRYQLLDAWTNQTTTTNGHITPTVPANAVVLYRVSSAPTVTTGSPNSVGTTSATVSGTVNPNGRATTYHFDYGTSTSYGSTAPGSPYPSAGSGTTAQSVSTNLTVLAASTTYHYRLEATNATGTTYGSDETFATASGVSNAPQGSWVGTYGANGYELAAWSGGSDVVAMPGVSLSVSTASRYLWASNTTNVRALQSADRSTRNAATYYSSSGFKVALRFSSAYSGNLALYAVDLDKALDDHHRDPLMRKLHSVGMAKLMRRQAPARPRPGAGPAQFAPDRCRGPWSPATGTMQDAEQRPTGSWRRSSSHGSSVRHPHASRPTSRRLPPFPRLASTALRAGSRSVSASAGASPTRKPARHSTTMIARRRSP